MTGRSLANAASNQAAKKNIIHIINRNCKQRSGVSSFASLNIVSMPLLFWGTLVNKKGQHFLINRRWGGSIEKAWRLDSDPSCLCFAQYFSSGSLTNFSTTIKVAKLLWQQVMSQLKNLTGLVTNSILFYWLFTTTMVVFIIALARFAPVVLTVSWDLAP